MPIVHDIPTKQTEIEKNAGVPVVAITKVSKSFGKNTVLSDISLNVNHGETLGVLGRSGTGKSVLLRLIIGLIQPDSGSVCVFGQNLAGMTLDQMGTSGRRWVFSSNMPRSTIR